MKILLIKLNHIGDTLLLTPSLVAIREKYPNCKIDVVVRKGCEGILKNNPFLDNIISIAAPEKKNRNFYTSIKDFIVILQKLTFQRYDYTFDLNNSDRARMINFLSLSKRKVVNSWHTNLQTSSKKYFYTDFIEYAWGKEHQVLKDYYTIQPVLKLSKNIPSLYINTDIETNIFNKLDIQKENYVVIHPTTRWTFKQWEISKWKKVISYLNSIKLKVIVTCGPDVEEIKYVKEILEHDSFNESTYGKTLLIETAKLIENAKIFIGVDTAAAHISAAVKTPSIILFGPTDEWSWYPWNVRHELALGECSCKINRKIICDKSKTLPCMGSISVELIQSKIKKLLDQ